MVRQPDATVQATPQDNQLMSKHRVLSLKPQLRLEWRAQDGQNETKQPDHSASLGDSITSSTRTGFSVHTRPSILTYGYDRRSRRSQTRCVPAIARDYVGCAACLVCSPTSGSPIITSSPETAIAIFRSRARGFPG